MYIRRDLKHANIHGQILHTHITIHLKQIITILIFSKFNFEMKGRVGGKFKIERLTLTKTGLKLKISKRGQLYGLMHINKYSRGNN